MRMTYWLLSAVAVVFSASMAHAAARLVLVPVTVGGSGVPAEALMAGLARGLGESHQWGVQRGADLKVAAEPTASLTPEQVSALSTGFNQVSEKLARGQAQDVIPVLEKLRADLNKAAEAGQRGEAGDAAAYRAGALLVTALLAGNDADRAKTVGGEVALSFPGRKPAEADGIPAATAELLVAPAPPAGAKVTVKTRPEGCAIWINGTQVGQGVADVAVLPGLAYYAQATCPTPSGAPLKTRPKKIQLAANETTRQELLDAEFGKALRLEGDAQVHFESSDERRQLEEAYARRVAEIFGADVVVFTSVGELSGADWLSARLYLRSGYLNRQALVRLDAGRAVALGRYLGDGKESPGVLKPDEAGALVAAGPASGFTAADVHKAWYTDVLGWTLTGAGAVGLTLGLWSNAVGDRKTKQADMVRGDNDRQQAIYQEAQSAKFMGDIGTVGGGLLMITGVILLAVPEYDEGAIVAVTPLRGGGMFAWAGHF